MSSPTICISQSAVQWTLKAVYSGVKRLEDETFHLFKSIAEGDKEWHFTSR